MRRHDLTKKSTFPHTYLPTYLSTYLRAHPQDAILETCDLYDICSEWWGDLTWPKKTLRCCDIWDTHYNTDNLCYLTINCDTGQHSQFLRCFCRDFAILSTFLGGPVRSHPIDVAKVHPNSLIQIFIHSFGRHRKLIKYIGTADFSKGENQTCWKHTILLTVKHTNIWFTNPAKGKISSTCIRHSALLQDLKRVQVCSWRVLP